MSDADQTTQATMLVIGYGLAAVLYGGYWLYLRQRTSKLTSLLASKKAR
jgi:hypothetical protein